MSALAFRYATDSDVVAYYGERPPQTIRAIVITLDEQPAALIGLARMQNYNCLFSEHKPELVPHLHRMTVLRAIKAAMRLLSHSILPVAAVAENPVLLTRLGLVPSANDPEVFLWHS